jgi:hypothetical protein
MRGSIRKRGSTYTYWLDVGPDPVTGKRRQRTKGGFRTKRECQVALNAAIAAVQGGTFVEPSRRTVGSFLLDEWLPAVQMANLRSATWENYRIHVQAHIVPALGTVELQRLSPAQLNAFYRHLLTAGGKDGQGLASKTVRNIHNILHRALKDAVRWGLLLRNVADAADPPKGKSAEMRVWSPDQLRVFLEWVREDDLYAAWLLVTTTGMRRGELGRAALGRRRLGCGTALGAAAASGGGECAAALGAEDGAGSPFVGARRGDSGGAAPAPEPPA